MPLGAAPYRGWVWGLRHLLWVVDEWKTRDRKTKQCSEAQEENNRRGKIMRACSKNIVTPSVSVILSGNEQYSNICVHILHLNC